MTDAAEIPPPPAPQEEPPMEIHKPKPVHSWRELATEIGVIVIGVCIALAGEQAVEWLHWREQVAQAKEVIATELTHNVVGAIQRLRTADCVEQRLDTLAKILDTAAKSGSLPPVGDIGQPPRHLWPSGAWESIVASETATHFPRQQLADLAAIYKVVDKAEVTTQSEFDAWSDLTAIVGPGRRFDPASETELRRALSRARSDNRTVASLVSLLIARVKEQNLPFSQGDLGDLAAVQRESLTSGQITAATGYPMFLICRPIGPAPAYYGQGTGTALPPLIQQTVRHLPDFSAGAP